MRSTAPCRTAAVDGPSAHTASLPQHVPQHAAHRCPPRFAAPAQVSKGLGEAMSGIGNIKESQVAFRERGS